MAIERIHVRLVDNRNRTRGLFPLEHPYVEDFWMSILGPTAVAILRHVGRNEHTYADPGTTLDIEELSVSFGLKNSTGRWSPLVRTLDRLSHFGVGQWDIGPEEASSTLAISIDRRLDVVPLGHVRRWSTHRQDDHRAAVLAQIGESVA